MRQILRSILPFLSCLYIATLSAQPLTDSLKGFDEVKAMQKAQLHNCYGKEAAVYIGKSERDFIKDKYGLKSATVQPGKYSVNIVANLPCVDEGFEPLPTGTLATSAWTPQVSNNTQMVTALCASTAVTYSVNSTQASVVTTPVTDALCNNVGHSPLGGSKILQLNRNNFNTIPSRVVQTFSVAGTNAFYHYAYKAVLNASGGHSCCEQPFIAFNFYDCSGNLLPALSKTISSNNCSGGNPDAAFWLTNSTGFDYTPNWVMHSVNLSAYIGTCITAEIFAMGCIYTGHEGYLYYDALCSGSQIAPNNILYVNSAAVSSYSTCDQQPLLGAVGGFSSYLWQGPANSGVHNSTLTTVSPTVSGTYTLLASNSTNTYSQTLNLVIHPLPNVTVAATKTLLCGGDSAVLTMSGASTYFWWNTLTYTSSLLVKPSTPTQYTIVGTSANGCTKVIFHNVHAEPYPNILLAKGGLKDSICPGDSVLIYGWATGSMLWSNGITTGTFYAKPSVTTVYGLTVTSNAGCVSQGTIGVKVIPYPQPVITLSKDTACSNDYISVTATGPFVHHVYWQGIFTIQNPAYFWPAANQVYTLLAMNSLNCATQKTFDVAIHPVLSATLFAPSYPPCLGQPYQYTVAGTNLTTYSWTSGSITNVGTYTPVMTFVATVSVTNAHGCTSVLATPIMYANQPSGYVFLATSQHTICKGNSIVIDGYDKDIKTFWWDTGDSSNTLVAIPDSTTIYTFYGRDLAGCLHSASVQVHVDECVAVPDRVWNVQQLKVYPNPASKKLIINALPGADIIFYDNLGREVLHHKQSRAEETIEDHHLAPGVYQVRSGQSVFRLLIE